MLTSCATHHITQLYEAVPDQRGVPRCTEKHFIDLAHNWEKVHTQASSIVKRLGRSVPQRRMPRETEKPPLTMIDEEPMDGISTSKNLAQSIDTSYLRDFH